MDTATARRMGALTTDFYDRVAASFSATRQAPWQGWRRLLEVASLTARPLRVLDVACGNWRFERFLQEEGLHVEAWGVDNCDELAAPEALACAAMLHYQHLDISQALFAGCSLVNAIQAPPCDCCVAFGFLHHLAMPEHRFAVLRALVDHARFGGIVAVSFWQFDRDPRLRAKARPLEGGDQGDYLLGWQDSHATRYCHSFSETEVDELVTSIKPAATELARFSADGRSGHLNRYVVLKKETASHSL